MFLSSASVRRPTAMSCLIIALTLLGLNALRKMPLETMPKVDVPFVTIVTAFPGASPEQIETDVAKRIEDQVVTIDGLKHVNSSCMENVCHTMLEFELDVDVDIAATDVREKLDLIKGDFPDDVEDPIILKFDINSQPIMTLALTGDRPLDELYDYADNTLSDSITVIPGVADLELIGGAEREVQILLDRDELASKGLTSAAVVAAVQNGVRKVPSGRIKDKGIEYSVEFDADFQDVDEIGTLELINESGQRCYINDVGEVKMSTEELRQKAFINGTPCIALKVVKKAGANAVEVVDRIKEALSELNKTLPSGMELVYVADDGIFTKALVSSAWMNIIQGVLLTALILFLFLYNLRATFIVCVTMPLTFVIGMFFMGFMNYSLNTPTLLAIGMSVGILVTNSIVVMEAIVKRLDQTGDPVKAANLGTSEAAIAVIASAGTNLVVLFPIADMSGMMGLFIRPFAVTMIIMTAVSLFISFTLTPLLCSLILKAEDKKSKSVIKRMEKGFDRGLGWVIERYRGVLRFFERRRWAASLFVIVVVIALLYSFVIAGGLGFAFVQTPDKGEIITKLSIRRDMTLSRPRPECWKLRNGLRTCQR